VLTTDCQGWQTNALCKSGFCYVPTAAPTHPPYAPGAIVVTNVQPSSWPTQPTQAPTSAFWGWFSQNYLNANSNGGGNTDNSFDVPPPPDDGAR